LNKTLGTTLIVITARALVVAEKARKYYHIMKSGRSILEKAMSQVQELIDEINET
jgi:DNA-binding PadR family transcriptional regulator